MSNTDETSISDPRPQRALHRAHRALEEELRALLRTDRAAEILERALDKVVSGSSDDPARELRSIVGARLLDEVADLLSRVEEVIDLPPEELLEASVSVPEPVRMEQAIDERKARARIQRRWTSGTGVARRILG